MFPDTPIMIITTTLSDLAFRSEKAKQSALDPAVDYLISRQINTHFHIHCLSEGGSHKAIQFAKAYLSHTGSRLALTSLCLDSTPGDHQYHRLARAFTLSLPPNVFLRALGLLFAYLMLTCLWTFYALYGPNKNIMTRIRRGLEDQSLWDTQHIPRCYLYSEKDTLIKYQDVERHARKAQKKGVRVWTVRFQHSEHCHHVKEDREKYWEGVRWTLGMRDGGTQQGRAVEVEKEKEMMVEKEQEQLTMEVAAEMEAETGKGNEVKNRKGKEKEKEASSSATSTPMVLASDITQPTPVAQRGSTT